MKYQEVISLGFGCMVAQDLEKWGRRNNSFPFDWVISDFQDVIRMIENGFLEILKEIQQDEIHNNVYHDMKTGIDYYHDFFPDKSIEMQIDAVCEKYERRIQRFNKTIKNPTLFLRFIRNEKDLSYIEENFEKIQQILKISNAENTCLYILTKELAQKTKLQNIFVTTDNEHPVLKCKELKTFIRKNLCISRTKINKNKLRYITKSLKKFFRR